MKLYFIGADHEVTGSCHVIETSGKYIMLDCGLEKACQANDVIYSGVNTYGGHLTCKNVADAHPDLGYTDIHTLF